MTSDAPQLIPLGRTGDGRLPEYQFELRRDEESIPVKVVRRRRKTMALYVEKDGRTELRVPINGPWADIEAFLRSRFDWIVAARAELASRPAAPANSYESGGHVRYLGRVLNLELVRSQFSLVKNEADSLLVTCRNPANARAVEQQVLDWYRKEAGKLLPDRVEALNPAFLDRISPGAISVRKMKARWGSCSSRGDLCFNLFLLQEHLSQIDFVVAHELCHLRHFAHNGAFYRLLDTVMPDWRDREARLGLCV